jgi:hypothetical protein
MKRTTTLSLMLVAIAVTTMSFVNDDKYIITMQKNIQMVYAAQTIPELQAAVNGFARIADVEKTKWEPHYYAAFGTILMATREADGAKKDEFLDLADASIKAANALVKNESELLALEGFVHMMRITVDPASRGQKYSPLAYQAFGKAVALNGDNPRALSLLAQMQFGTAQFFNSPVTEACTTLQKALDKFETYKSTNPLAPNWGREMTEGLKGNCK